MANPPSSDVDQPLSLRLTEEQLTLLQQHQQKMRGLEGIKSRVLQGLEDVERVIAQARQEFGDSFNSQSILRQLPDDIYVTIFLMAQEGDRDSAKAPKINIEIALSHVCRQWRELVFSIPWLWTLFRYDGDQRSSLPVDRLNAYIARSRQLPLDLRFRFKLFDTPQAHEIWKEGYEQLCAILPQVLHRCQSLSIRRVPSSYPINSLHLGLPKSSAPIFYSIDSLLLALRGHPALILESLCLIRGNTRDRAYNPTPAQAVWVPALFRSEAPALKYVRLDETCLRANFQPPLTSVVHVFLEQTSRSLEADFLDFSAFISLLTLPLLETISIDGFDDLTNWPCPGDIQGIEAKFLKHLRFSLGEAFDTEESSMVSYLLSCVSAPRLESLTFRAIELSSDLSIPEGHFPSLRTIHLIDCSLPKNLQHFANVTRTTKRLVIEDDGRSTDSVDVPSPLIHIASGASTLGIWRHLEEVQLNADAELVDLEDVFPMLQAVTLHQDRFDILRSHPDWEPFERLRLQVVNDGALLARPWPSSKGIQPIYAMEDSFYEKY